MRYIYCLPWPPSSNEAHVHRIAKIKNGPKAGKQYTARMLSKEAKDFRRHVAVAVREGHRTPPKLQGRLWGTVLICPPVAWRAMDLDNRVKQTLDALEEAEVFKNDSQFDAIPIFRGAAVPGGRVLVSIEDYDPARAEAMVVAAGLPRPWETVETVKSLPF